MPSLGTRRTLDPDWFFTEQTNIMGLMTLGMTSRVSTILLDTTVMSCPVRVGSGSRGPAQALTRTWFDEFWFQNETENQDGHPYVVLHLLGRLRQQGKRSALSFWTKHTQIRNLSVLQACFRSKPQELG